MNRKLILYALISLSFIGFLATPVFSEVQTTFTKLNTVVTVVAKPDADYNTGSPMLTAFTCTFRHLAIDGLTFNVNSSVYSPGIVVGPTIGDPSDPNYSVTTFLLNSGTSIINWISGNEYPIFSFTVNGGLGSTDFTLVEDKYFNYAYSYYELNFGTDITNHTLPFYAGSDNLLVSNVGDVHYASQIMILGKYWLTTGTNDWNTGTNWSDGSVPTSGQNIAIISGGIQPVAGPGSVCNKMRIETGATVSIKAGGALTANGDITITDPNSLKVESSALGNGSIITYGAVTGTSTVQQYIKDSYYADKWHLISVPVDEVSSYNTFLHFYLKRYSESTGLFDDVQEIPGPGGTQLLNIPMEGFSTSFRGWFPDTTLSFVGNLNTGNKSIGYTFTPGKGDGWNLLGNPYPSSIDWDLVVDPLTFPTTLNPTVYLYDGAIMNYKWYLKGNLLSTASKFIPPSQGFFVQATDNGTLSFTNSQRAHGTQNFYKESSNYANCLKFQTSGNSYSDVSFIMFDGNATSGFDRNFDVPKLMGASVVPSIYSYVGNDAFALNSLASIDETPKVEMVFKTGQNGTYSISASGMESFDSNVPLLLEDLVTNQVIDLRQSSVYSFAYNTNDPLHRFNVHFKNTFGINDISDGNVNIFGGNKEIIVMFAKHFSGSITVTDIVGRTIYSGTANELKNVIPVTGSSQYYIVKVSGSSKVITEKVFVR